MSPVAVLLAIVAATPLTPFRATIADTDSIVRSGPGEAYYVTQYLPAGAAIEVHDRDESGWLAVRPPRGSFSWVPAYQLQETEQPGVAVVDADDCVAFIGTLLGTPEQYQWQVQMPRGEIVQILSHVERDVTTGTQVWCKIAPPSDEFRWIHESQVVLPGKAVAQQAPQVEPVAPKIRETVVEQTAPASLVVDQPKSQIAKANASPIPTAASDPAREATMDDEPPEIQQVGHWTAVRTDRPRRAFPKETENAKSMAPSGTPVLPSGKSAEAGNSMTANVSSERKSFTPATNDVHSLNVALTMLASQDAGLWDLQPLRDDATRLIDNGKTALERGQARLLLERIAEFELLQKRARQVSDEHEEREEIANLSTASARSIAVANGVQYDGSGILMPVHSTRGAAPPFALVDASGNVLSFVTPAPGLNLNRYVKKEVGLLGDRRYLDTLKSHHLTAERVVELDRHRR